MPPASRLSRPHPLLVLFLATTILPAAALVWLGWALVRQDAALERQRVGDALDLRAAAVATALERELASIEDSLETIVDGPDSNLAAESAVAVRLTAAGPAGHSGAPLLYLPADVVPGERDDDQRWREAERTEYIDRNASAALAAYRSQARSSDPDTRAGALVRLARVLKGQGRQDEALDAYTAMATIADGQVEGDPADLVARWARVDLLRALDRRDEADIEEAELASDLDHGRWGLDRTTYLAYSGRDPRDVATSAAGVLADAVLSTWADVQRSTGDRRLSAGRLSIRVEGGPALVVWRRDADDLLVFAATASYVADAWQAILAGDETAVALVDDDNAVVVGRRLPDTDQSATLRVADTGLPWSIQVAADATPAVIAEAGQNRRRLIIAGLAVLVVLLPASGYLVSRAVRRELAAARQQADFVSAVSHEFRSPLTSLTHLTSLLRGESPPSDERRRQYYDVLAHETDRLRRFVDTLLDFGRMRAGATRYRPVPVDLPALVGSTVDEFRKDPAAGRHDVTLETAGPAPRVSADPDALQRAIWNLLENAAKYSPAGSPIAVSVEAARDGVAIRVSDRGPGIPADEQPHLFEQFYRGASATRSAVPGTGVGLAVVSHIVTGHGGTVEVDSGPGTGTTFTIRLPRLEAVSAELEGSALRRPDAARSFPRRPTTDVRRAEPSGSADAEHRA